jgi:predicted ATPase
MHKIDRIEVEGLWGRSTVSLKLDPDVNLLLGKNGTGKTTVINLLVAALTVDFEVLLQTEFSSMTVVFRPSHGHAKPSVTISKARDDERGSLQITWSIRESQSGKPEAFVIEDVPERAFMQSTRRRMYRALSFDVEGLQVRLSRVFSLTWLSVLRGEQRVLQGREDDGASLVESKLADLSVRLGQYFAELRAETDVETKQFQEGLFLSLLADEVPASPKIDHLDLENERRELEEIYRQLDVPRERYEKRLKKHFDNVETAVSNAGGPTMDWPHGSALILNERTLRIVRSWNRVKQIQTEVFRPRVTFLSMVNSLMSPKTFVINAQNELVSRSPDGRDIRLSNLSSGEKQMLIILGEALLQRSSATIYIADEPELSLHISWQESLIDNVRSLNPNAQIVFATHSPDIVSTYQSRAQSMSEVLK